MRAATFPRHFFAVVALFCLTSLSRAELRGTYTVEALTCASEVIVIGELTDFSEKPATAREIGLEVCSIRVTEVLKGSAGEHLTFAHFQRGWRNQSWHHKGRGVLVFLRHANEQDDRRLGRQLIPTQQSDEISIVDLASLRPGIYDRGGRRVKTRNDLLDLVRAWAPQKIVHTLHRDADGDSEASQELQCGSGVWLFVPAEEKYRALFLQQAHAPRQWDRMEAAQELWKFPGPATERTLRELLEDVSENLPETGGEQTTASFPVREVAMESLQKLGLTRPDLPVERTLSAAERSRLRATYWTDLLRRSLPDEWRIIALSDGPTRKIQNRGGPLQDETIVQAEVGKGKERYRMDLVPLWWPPENFPAGRRLGEDMGVSNWPRIFFCDPALPAEVQAALVRRGHLVEPEWLREDWAKPPAERVR